MNRSIVRSSVLIGTLCMLLCLALTAIFQTQITKENRLQMDRIYHSLESETYET